MNEIIAQYKKCLEMVVREIPKDICGSAGDLTPEDYRTITTSVMIEHNRRGGYVTAPSTTERTAGGYAGPSTEKQQAFIAKLITRGKKETEERAQQFLDDNDLSSCEELDKSQAKELIDALLATIETNKGR